MILQTVNTQTQILVIVRWKIKNLNISRTMTDKERLSFCDGEIGFGTPKEDVENFCKGKEVVVNKGESCNEKTMYKIKQL